MSKLLIKPSRRSALEKTLKGSVLAGTAYFLPAAWKKPLVDAVILPAHAQTSILSACPFIPPVQFSTPGTTEYIIPDGVNLISIQAIGAAGGGGGSGAARVAAVSGAGGAGSSGQFVQLNNIAVSPGDTLTITVGAGGAGGAAGLETFMGDGDVYTGGGGGQIGGTTTVSIAGLTALGGNGGGGGGGSFIGTADSGQDAVDGGLGGAAAGLDATDGVDGDTGGVATNLNGGPGAAAAVEANGSAGEPGRDGQVSIFHCEGNP